MTYVSLQQISPKAIQVLIATRNCCQDMLSVPSTLFVVLNIRSLVLIIFVIMPDNLLTLLPQVHQPQIGTLLLDSRNLNKELAF